MVVMEVGFEVVVVVELLLEVVAMVIEVVVLIEVVLKEVWVFTGGGRGGGDGVQSCAEVLWKHSARTVSSFQKLPYFNTMTCCVCNG